MKSLPHSDIDDLYLYAQLVAEDAEEASVLLAKASPLAVKAIVLQLPS